MASTGSVATRKMLEFLKEPTNGIAPVLARIAEDSGVDLAGIVPAQIVAQNTPIGINERSHSVQYPSVHIYVDRIKNTLSEKFRRFSGKVRTIAEVRVSDDRIDQIEDRVRLYVEAVTSILDANRGGWGEGAFYAGGYEVVFEPVRHGGRNFLQVAKVTFEIDMSI